MSSPGFTARGDPGLQPSRTPCPRGWVVPTWEGTCRDRGAPPSLGQGPEAAAFGTSHGERTPASKPEQGGRGCSLPGQGARWSRPEQAPATSMPLPVHAPGTYSYNTTSSPGQAAAVLVCSCAKSVRAQGLGSAARGPGQDGPRAQASTLCTHRHPELQIPGSSRAGAKPGPRSGQRLHRGQRHRVRREQALPRGCSGRHASRGEDEGARQLLLSLAARGSGGGQPLQPAGTIPAAAELERGRLARRCRADTG